MKKVVLQLRAPITCMLCFPLFLDQFWQPIASQAGNYYPQIWAFQLAKVFCSLAFQEKRVSQTRRKNYIPAFQIRSDDTFRRSPGPADSYAPSSSSPVIHIFSLSCFFKADVCSWVIVNWCFLIRNKELRFFLHKIQEEIKVVWFVMKETDEIALGFHLHWTKWSAQKEGHTPFACLPPDLWHKTFTFFWILSILADPPPFSSPQQRIPRHFLRSFFNWCQFWHRTRKKLRPISAQVCTGWITFTAQKVGVKWNFRAKIKDIKENASSREIFFVSPLFMQRCASFLGALMQSET